MIIIGVLGTLCIGEMNAILTTGTFFGVARGIILAVALWI